MDEYGALTKEIRIAATQAVVYEVVSSPEHIRQWWSDEADFTPTAGAAGSLTWRNGASGRTSEVQLTVIEAVPAERFVFRWDYPAGETPTALNSLLVTFELLDNGDGTLLRVTEEGFRERGWEGAVLDEYYQRHDQGWDRHLGNLRSYVERRVPA